MKQARSPQIRSTRISRSGVVAVRNMAGVTLIELVVTIAIAGILLAIATPSYKNITNSSRIAAEVNGLTGDLQFARSEAIKEGQPITVCASTDNVNCNGSTNWHTGWVVFFDANGDGVVNNGEVALRIQKAFNSTDTFQATNTVATIKFNREGIAAGIANGTLIKLHDATSNSNWTRCLYVNMAGQISPLKYNQQDPNNTVTCT